MPKHSTFNLLQYGLPTDYYFTREHEWVTIRDGYAHIGITACQRRAERNRVHRNP